MSEGAGERPALSQLRPGWALAGEPSAFFVPCPYVLSKATVFGHHSDAVLDVHMARAGELEPSHEAQ